MINTHFDRNISTIEWLLPLLLTSNVVTGRISQRLNARPIFFALHVNMLNKMVHLLRIAYEHAKYTLSSRAQVHTEIHVRG